MIAQIKKSMALAAVVVLFSITGLSQSSSALSNTVERRVNSILSQMTIEEKIDPLGGVDDFYVRGVPRLGIPRLKMADGPLGVRNYGLGNNDGWRNCAGATVAQVYVAARFPKVEHPPKELKDFAKVNLRAGEKPRVTLRLDKRALSYYDTASKQWWADPQFEVLVGSSSDNIRLRQQFALPETATAENRSR